MFGFLRDLINSIPPNLMFMLIFVMLAAIYKNFKKAILENREATLENRERLNKFYAEYHKHITDSDNCNRESMRKSLRELYNEIKICVLSNKEIKQELLEEFYSQYAIYRDKGGNGIILHFKEEIDCWTIKGR